MSTPARPAVALPTAPVPHIGFGQVWHTRLRPRRHRFAYRVFFVLLPMRTLQERPQAAGVLAYNRRGALSFHDADHGDGRSPAVGGALAWLDALLATAGIHDAVGEAWLQCFPRVLGYAFKPVSFWYCHRADGSLRAIVAEVNNTFGERHVYLLDAPRPSQPLVASKVFHVSPFCPVEGAYHFTFAGQPDALDVRIDYHDAQGALLRTGLAGRLAPLDAALRRRALWRHPFMTLAVIARIHWHALRLFAKRVPFFRKPPPPLQTVSRSTPH